MSDCKPLPVFTQADIEKFWSRVDMRAPDECWEWTRGKLKFGYGHFTLIGSMRALKTNRVALFLATGTDPFPLQALHHCDNPPCCNPSHLYRGTSTENNRDTVRRGRARRDPRNRSFGYAFAACVRRWLAPSGYGYCSTCHHAIQLIDMALDSSRGILRQYARCKECTREKSARYHNKNKRLKVPIACSS